MDSMGRRVLVKEEGDQHERRATTTELYYDLVFVAVLARLVHLFLYNPFRWQEYIVMFMAVWRVWQSGAYFATMWQSNDLSCKLALYFFVLADCEV
jgi:low temperature requirement protein LtrA